jgi:hypothetical protein
MLGSILAYPIPLLGLIATGCAAWFEISQEIRLLFLLDSAIPGLAWQLRQLRIRRNPSNLILLEQPCCRPPPRNRHKRAPVVAHRESGGSILNGPGRREAAVELEVPTNSEPRGTTLSILPIASWVAEIGRKVRLCKQQSRQPRRTSGSPLCAVWEKHNLGYAECQGAERPSSTRFFAARRIGRRHYLRQQLAWQYWPLSVPTHPC